MDAATVLVLVLSAGVVALLVWFEVNSRHNDAAQQRSDKVQSWFEALPRESHNKVEPASEKKGAFNPPRDKRKRSS